MITPSLGRDVYLALAAVAWADGFLDDEDSEAILKVATEDGLPPETINQIRGEISHRVPLASIASDSLCPEDRMFVYAVASWMARLDGAVSRNETQALTKVAVCLGLTEEQCEQARSKALEVAELGRRPKDYDLLSLRRRLRDAQ